MPNLKDIRTRISSITTTKQITSAMKMVSASKLKKSQNAITRLRPYSSKLQEILDRLCSGKGKIVNPFTQQNESEKVLFIVISANRGMCGAFNSNIAKKVKEISTSPEYEDKEKTYFFIGKKVYDLFKKKDIDFYDENLTQIFDHLTSDNAGKIADIIMRDYIDGDFGKVVIVYNRFKNAGVQILTDEVYLPLTLKKGEEENVSTDYIYEPDEETLISDIIPMVLRIKMFRILLDSKASEEGARMTSMHKATDNATEMLRDLKLVYNKARQAAITNEIIEISSGAEALK